MNHTKAQAVADVNGPVGPAGGETHFWVLQDSPEQANGTDLRSIEKALAAAKARTAARKEAEATRFQEKMDVPVSTEVPKQIKVRAGDVRFDARYQTDERFDEARAKYIAETFNWQECPPTSLNIRPGDLSETLWCYDGRHRTSAVIMRLGPDTLMNATLIHVPYEREAELFAEQDRLKKRVPKRIKFLAKIEAGDPEAMAQQAMLDRLGLTIGRRANTHTISLNAFLDCCRMKGLAATETGLGFAIGAWHGARESFEESIAKGIVWFVANRCDDPNYRPDRVRDVLVRASVREIEKAAGAKGDRLTAHQRVASVVVDLYNRNLAARSAITDWNPRKDR